MVKKPDEIFGVSVCALSGVVFLLALLFPISGSSTIMQFYALRIITPAYWIYFIPLGCGLFILAISGLLFINNRGLRLTLYILLILAMNFIFYFLLRVIEAQSEYIWMHPSIYVLILGICALLLGLFLTFSAQLNKQDR